ASLLCPIPSSTPPCISSPSSLPSDIPSSSFRVTLFTFDIKENEVPYYSQPVTALYLLFFTTFHLNLSASCTAHELSLNTASRRNPFALPISAAENFIRL